MSPAPRPELSAALEPDERKASPVAPAVPGGRSFRALNVTQFCGAFNDNFYKQVLLLLCVAAVKADDKAPDQQSLAAMLFAIPFIFGSGFAGLTADRWSKRTVIIGCKLAEIVIVLLGMLALALAPLSAGFVVLFLFGIHSTFFGPAKYGILPELLPAGRLPGATGLILMATFLAIIFGLASAGAAVSLARHWGGGQLWLASLVCLVIAIIGLIAALRIEPLPPAQPDLRFHWSALFVSPETIRLAWRQRALGGCLLASTVFWFAAGMVYPPAINRLAGQQMGLEDWAVGLLAASTGLGIAIGCGLAGWLSRRAISPRLVRTGAIGLAVSLGLLSLPGPGRGNTLVGVPGAVICLIATGIFAGCFSVPLQSYLQAATDPHQRGRIIAALNLCNWIGLAASGAAYGLLDQGLRAMHWPPAAMFGAAALVFAGLALAYQPPQLTLADDSVAAESAGAAH